MLKDFTRTLKVLDKNEANNEVSLISICYNAAQQECETNSMYILIYEKLCDIYGENSEEAKMLIKIMKDEDDHAATFRKIIHKVSYDSLGKGTPEKI